MTAPKDQPHSPYRAGESEPGRRDPQHDADRELVKHLEQEDFEGPAWNAVVSALIEYAYPIIRTWIDTGQIAIRAAERGVRVPTNIPPLTGEDVEDLAQEVFVASLEGFRRQLRLRRWSPERGASLSTYFIGQCLFQFPNAYRRWRRATSHERPVTLLREEDDDHPVATGEAGDPAVIVTDRMAVSELLSEVTDERNRSVLELRSQGYSYAEIAKSLGLTAKAVDGALHRYRRTLRDRAKR